MLPIIVLLVGPIIAGLLSLVIGCSRLLHVVNFSTMLALVGADTAFTTRICRMDPSSRLASWCTSMPCRHSFC